MAGKLKEVATAWIKVPNLLTECRLVYPAFLGPALLRWLPDKRRPPFWLRLMCKLSGTRMEYREATKKANGRNMCTLGTLER